MTSFDLLDLTAELARLLDEYDLAEATAVIRLPDGNTLIVRRRPSETVFEDHAGRTCGAML